MYHQFLVELGPEVFKRPLFTHRNGITTGWMRVGKESRVNSKARESILEEDLAKNVSSYREPKVKKLPNHSKKLREQKKKIRAYEQLKAWEEIVISSEDEKELTRQITVSSASEPSTSKARGYKLGQAGTRGGFSSQGKELGLERELRRNLRDRKRNFHLQTIIN